VRPTMPRQRVAKRPRRGEVIGHLGVGARIAAVLGDSALALPPLPDVSRRPRVDNAAWQRRRLHVASSPNPGPALGEQEFNIGLGLDVVGEPKASCLWPMDRSELTTGRHTLGHPVRHKVRPHASTEGGGFTRVQRVPHCGPSRRRAGHGAGMRRESEAVSGTRGVGHHADQRELARYASPHHCADYNCGR